MVKTSAGECTIRDGMTLGLPLLRRAFVFATVAWSLALPLATFAASGPHSSSGLYLLSLSVYFGGGVVCHQLPPRSFFVWGSQMPVCARCTGIYAGAAVAAIVAVVMRRGGPMCPPGADTQDGPYDARVAFVLAALPTAATLAYEWITGPTPSNWTRAAAGVPIGAVVAWIVWHLRPDGAEG